MMELNYYGTALTIKILETLKELESENAPMTVPEIMQRINPYTSHTQRENFRTRTYATLKRLVDRGELKRTPVPTYGTNIVTYHYAFIKKS